jgi:hypothetical protein
MTNTNTVRAGERTQRVLPSVLPEDDGRLVWPEDEGHLNSWRSRYTEAVIALRNVVYKLPQDRIALAVADDVLAKAVGLRAIPPLDQVEYGYPKDWPHCPGCGRPAMDGHITCGRAECDEGGHRS